MGNLTAADLAGFATLGIPAALLERARVPRVTDRQAREQFGIRGGGDMAGIAFPYWEPSSMMNGAPWRRYLSANPPSPPIRNVATSQPASAVNETDFPTRHTEPHVTDGKSEESPVFTRGVTAVTFQKGGNGHGALPDPCFVHGGGADFWQRPSGEWVCRQCHPQPGGDVK
jgi:hypothetical protein